MNPLDSIQKSPIAIIRDTTSPAERLFSRSRVAQQREENVGYRRESPHERFRDAYHGSPHRRDPPFAGPFPDFDADRGAAARYFGVVVRPERDRWHTRPTALLGGVVLFAAIAGVAATMVVDSLEQARGAGLQRVVVRGGARR